MKKNILILGAGFSGVQVALTLAKSSGDHEITLINDSPYHSFHADLYEVATAILEKEHKIDFKHLAGTVNIPLIDIFSSTKVKILVEKVQSVDLLKREVITTASSHTYDYLVLALGSKANYFGIPGAEEHAHPFKTTEDALNVRNDIEELVYQKEEPVQVVVAGGGLSGIEVAAQMRSFIADVAKKHQKKIGSVTIIEAADTLMPSSPRWLIKLGVRQLKKRQVRIKTQTKILRIEQDQIVCADDIKVPYDYLLWTTGIKGNGLEGNIKGVEFTSNGKIPVGTDLQLKEYAHVYVAGDLAYILNKKTSFPVPATAWAAISMGKQIGNNILRQLHENSTEEYLPNDPVFVIPLGRKQGVGMYGKIHITGVIAWGLKRLISLKYFASILPLQEAISVWRKGVTIFIHND